MVKKQLKSIKKFHIEAFGHAWDVKVSVPIFKVIFLGLALVVLFAGVIYAANMATKDQLTTGSRASEDEIDLCSSKGLTQCSGTEPGAVKHLESDNGPQCYGDRDYCHCCPPTPTCPSCKKSGNCFDDVDAFNNYYSSGGECKTESPYKLTRNEIKCREKCNDGWLPCKDEYAYACYRPVDRLSDAHGGNTPDYCSLEEVNKDYFPKDSRGHYIACPNGFTTYTFSRSKNECNDEELCGGENLQPCLLNGSIPACYVTNANTYTPRENRLRKYGGACYNNADAAKRYGMKLLSDAFYKYFGNKDVPGCDATNLGRFILLRGEECNSDERCDSPWMPCEKGNLAACYLPKKNDQSDRPYCSLSADELPSEFDGRLCTQNAGWNRDPLTTARGECKDEGSVNQCMEGWTACHIGDVPYCERGPSGENCYAIGEEELRNQCLQWQSEGTQ